MPDIFAGGDVGGTSIKCALATADGQILKSENFLTDSNAGPEVLLQRIGEAINHLANEVGQKPKSLGMGLPGLVDIKLGIARYLPNMMSHWKNVPVAEIMQPIVNCPVQLLNDVRMATYGELVFGHGSHLQTMVFIAIGTGIGGGLSLNGKLHLGPLGAAGELGHQTIEPTGPLCGCGNHGCLETLASGTALLTEGIRLMLVGMAPTLHQLSGGDLSKVTVELMGQAARQDPAIKQAIEHAAFYLAIAVSNVIVTVHPELVVFGGGVAKLGDLLLDKIKQDVKQRVGRLFPVDDIEFKTTKLDSQAGMFGAIALASRGLPA